MGWAKKIKQSGEQFRLGKSSGEFMKAESSGSSHQPPPPSPQKKEINCLEKKTFHSSWSKKSCCEREETSHWNGIRIENSFFLQRNYFWVKLSLSETLYVCITTLWYIILYYSSSYKNANQRNKWSVHYWQVYAIKSKLDCTS